MAHSRCTPAFLALALLFVAAWPGTAAAHVLDAGGAAPTSFDWNFEPVVAGALAVSLSLYMIGFRRLSARAAVRSRRRRGRQGAAFVAGWATLVVALLSPLDALGAALFSAHMVQHELLMLIAAPLLVLGRPLGVWVWAFPLTWRHSIGRAVHWRPLRTLWVLITAPLGAWLLHAAALWLWHAPRLFQAALQHQGLHTFQHTSFLASALLFWWTIFGRQPGGDAGAPAMLSLFTTMVHTGALGALLTLAPALWYPLYATPTAALGFDPLQDQQMGGLVMWVPGGAAYLVSAMVIAGRWLIERPTQNGASTEAS